MHRGSSREGGLYCCLGTLAVLAAMLAIAPAADAAGKQLTVDYSFAYPEVTQVTIDGVEYDRVSVGGCTSGGDVGAPALPAFGARILLPFGSEVTGIDIIGEKIILGDGYLVEPMSQPVKLSAGAADIVLPTPDPEIYEAAGAYPVAAFEEIGTHAFRGYQILFVKLNPVEFVPATGELSYYPNMTVVVNTVNTGRLSTLYRGLEADEDEVMTKVDNPAEVGSYVLTGAGDRGGFDLLIITTSTLAGSFQPLADYHNANGIATEIHTTADIGGSDADTLRSYITDRYVTDGIRYAIIGGDDDILPAKNLYVQSYSGGDIETAMPGDLFYGCLDGTWNYDGDSYWGEPTDGPGGNDVDLVAEVYIGRACGGNTTEINRFVTKTLWYLNGSHTQIEKVLLVGEYLGFGGISDYAAATLEQLIDGSNADGYTTVGIPSDQYVVDELFERDMSWSRSTLASRINNGVHLLDHLGHGSPDYAMKFYNSDVLSDLNNTDLIFVYSQTCLAGHFDNDECWAETINVKTDHGAFGVVMNARYGWGSYNSTDGPSQRFNREFWDAVYGEGLMEMGRANHDSKEDNLYRINDSCGRWCYYELNLFGDPTVQFRGVAGLGFDYPSGIPATVTPGQTTTFEVAVAPTGDGVLIPDSGQLHYSIDGGAYVTVDMNEIFGGTYEAVLPALSCGSTIEFYFTAEEATNGTYSDPREAPAEVYSAFPVTEVVNIFDDNFETNQGWSVSGNAADGQWTRGIPVGGGDRGDPANDYDGSGRCYLTDNVDDNSDVDDGYTYLDSPTFDLSEGDAEISYALWYTNNFGADPNNDLFKIYVSNNNGGTWTVVEIVGPQTPNGWNVHSFMVGDFVTPTAQVRVRFEASDLNDGSVVEAGVDDFLVLRQSCEELECPGDLDGDYDVDLADLSQMLANYGTTSGAEYEDGDLDGDGDVDLADLSALLAVYGTTCS